MFSRSSAFNIFHLDTVSTGFVVIWPLIHSRILSLGAWELRLPISLRRRTGRLSGKQYTSTFFSEMLQCLFLQVAKYAGLYTRKYLGAYLQLGSVAVEEHQKAIHQWSSLHYFKTICTQLTKPPTNLHHCFGRCFGSIWVILCVKHRRRCRHHLQSKNATNKKHSRHAKICGIKTRSMPQEQHLLLLSTISWGLAACLSTALWEQKGWRKNRYVLLQNFVTSLMT